MPDYEKLYHQLYNDVTDAIEKLKKAQCFAEDKYLDMCEKEFPNGEDLEFFEEETDMV